MGQKEETSSLLYDHVLMQASPLQGAFLALIWKRASEPIPNRVKLFQS